MEYTILIHHDDAKVTHITLGKQHIMSFLSATDKVEMLKVWAHAETIQEWMISSKDSNIDGIRQQVLQPKEDHLGI